ncbi:hypothetical protein GU243_00810 [Pseudarthrobacter psychrotolerans]|uniref:Uncharacterized protein n=1 Tax=Pseudarthrobacter psychrotolerans TaxID=2697569 RepID=A0A6P1NLY7_9MICC|nr:hypothetical protein GU243_00810 [Pseudarthrobacter psychrotolerans]
MGDTDDDDVAAKVLECKLKGLSDFFVEGQARIVRAFAVDPLSGREFYLMLLGRSGPDDFTFVEVIDGRAQDVGGRYVDIDQWMSAAPGTNINDFLEIVGSDMDGDFWDAALGAFLDLYSTIIAAITTALYHAEQSQGEHMTQLCEWANVEAPTGRADAEAEFQAFTDACNRRAPFADVILVEFPDHTDLFPDMVGFGEPLPRVSFGYRFGPSRTMEQDPALTALAHVRGVKTPRWHPTNRSPGGLRRSLTPGYAPRSWTGSRSTAATLKPARIPTASPIPNSSPNKAEPVSGKVI